MSDWQDISAAPKGSGDYLVYQPEHRAGRSVLGARITLNSQAGYSRKSTHWHPLPSPPETSPNGLGAGS